MFSLNCVRINGWVNSSEAGDLRRHPAHYDVTVIGCPCTGVKYTPGHQQTPCWLGCGCKVTRTILRNKHSDLKTTNIFSPRKCGRSATRWFLYICRVNHLTQITPYATVAYIAIADALTVLIGQMAANNIYLYLLCNIFPGILTVTWSETYFRQDLFPSYLFSRRQFHAIVIFRLKSISDLDSGSLPRFFGEFLYMKIKIVVSQQRLDVKWPKYARQWIGLGFELGLVPNSVSSG